MVSVSEENVSGIDTHFRKYRIGGIDTFGIVSPITITKYKYIVWEGSYFRIFGRPQGAYNTQNNSYCILIVIYNVYVQHCTLSCLLLNLIVGNIADNVFVKV